MKELAQALLRVEDVNVLVVDWIYRASFAYNLVVQSHKEVALQVSILINQLQVSILLFPFWSTDRFRVEETDLRLCSPPETGM